MAFLAAALPMIAAGMTAAGGVTSAIGAYGQGQAMAQAARTNADIATMEGLARKEEAVRQEQISREKSARLISKQTALYGKAGVTMSGSPLDVMADQAYQAEMDALAIRHQGELAKWKAGTESAQYDWQAGNYETAGKIAAGSTLLTAGGKMLMNGMKAPGKAPASMDDEEYWWQMFNRGKG